MLGRALFWWLGLLRRGSLARRTDKFCSSIEGLVAWYRLELIANWGLAVIKWWFRRRGQTALWHTEAGGFLICKKDIVVGAMVLRQFLYRLQGLWQRRTGKIRNPGL